MDGWQALVMAIWPFLQQWMKKTSLPMFGWITAESKKLNMALSPIVALVATLGFHFEWTGDAQTGWHLSMMIPPMVALGHAAGQWVGQHLIYTMGIQSPATHQEILAELKTLNAKS